MNGALLLFCMQEPVTITLGTEYHYRASGTKRRLVEKCETFQYVPFLKNLEWMLQNPDICHEVHVNTPLRSLRYMCILVIMYCCRFLKEDQMKHSIYTISVMARCIKITQSLALMTLPCK